MTTKIIGCGTLIGGDDGIGVLLVREMNKTLLPLGVEAIEGGTDPLRLLEHLRNTNRVILVDAITGAGNPGDVFVLSPGQIDTEPVEKLSLHQFSLTQVLQLGNILFPQEMPQEILIVGIEAENIEAYRTCISPAVAKAIPEAITVICKLCQSDI